MCPIPTPGAADTGGADPAVAAALSEYDRTGAAGKALAALSRSRVLVAVTAVADGPSGADSASLATVLSTGVDGRQALLAFTCLDALMRWQPTARPVPQPMRSAARAALCEGAAALVVDLAGPVPLTIQGDDLQQLAAGLVLVPTADGHTWALPGAALRPWP